MELINEIIKSMYSVMEYRVLIEFIKSLWQTLHINISFVVLNLASLRTNMIENWKWKNFTISLIKTKVVSRDLGCETRQQTDRQTERHDFGNTSP